MDYDRLRELQEKFNENPRRYFAPLANEYRKAGNAKRAIEICRAHLAQMPGHMSGQVVYGQALFEGGEFDEARKVFEGALVLDPENLIALRSLGDLSLQAGNTEEARTWYSRLLDADPKDAAVIALVSEIDASLEASPAPAAAEIPGIDPDGGDQQIADLDQATAPIGLERHYPTEPPPAEAPEPVVTEMAKETQQSMPAARKAHPPRESAANAAAASEEWRPPSGAAIHETAGGGAEDPAFTGASAEPFVNETMAQLYLQQGYRQLALKVYRQLSQMKPGDQALKDRISEIESADAREIGSTPEARREEPPSVESPTPVPATPPAPSAPPIETPLPRGPASQPPSVETPSFDRTPIDSPPSSTPSPGGEPDSVESPAREEPRAEPEGKAARQPSIREFFATLGRRRPPRPSGASPRATAAPSASLDAVFAGATVSSADSRAATTLAGAFSASARGSTPPPSSASPTPRSNPRMQTHESEEDVAKFRAWLDGLTGE